MIVYNWSFATFRCRKSRRNVGDKVVIIRRLGQIESSFDLDTHKREMNLPTTEIKRLISINKKPQPI